MLQSSDIPPFLNDISTFRQSIVSHEVPGSKYRMKQLDPRREDVAGKTVHQITRMALTTVQSHLLVLAVATKLLLYPA